MVVLLFSLPVRAQEVSPSQFMFKVEGFKHPESVVLDSVHNVLYISNIGDGTPGDGFISRVTVNGGLLDRKWVGNLNGPKGLLLLNDTLWVTDNTDLVAMDINTAKVVDRIPVEDASFLNDIAVDHEGVLYFSDSGKSSIYKREISGEIEEWLKTEDLEFVNGLLVVDNGLYVAAWGGEGPGNVLRVDLDTKNIEQITAKGLGNLDGIQQIDNNEFYVSDWATGKIYKIDWNGNATEVFTSDKSAGDFLFLKEQQMLVLPMNHQNEVWWYQLK